MILILVGFTFGVTELITNRIAIQRCNTEMQLKKLLRIEKKYSLELTKKSDLISDKEIDILKIIAPDPLSIGGTENSIREKVTSWEADIKYHENYLYDTRLNSRIILY